MGRGAFSLNTVLKGRRARKTPGREACQAALHTAVALRLSGKVTSGSLLVEPLRVRVSQRQTHSGRSATAGYTQGWAFTA